jgi:uncharacterized RDD family membrane protein YckC
MMKSYQIAREGQALGEFVEAQIQEGLQTGYFLPTDWCWSEGMAEWQGLGGLFQQPRSLPAPNMVMEAAVNPYAAPRSNVVRPSNTPKRLLQRASLGARFGANLLDNLTMVACVVPFAFLSDSNDLEQNDMTYLAGGLGLLLLLVIVNCIFLITNGQTIGKKMVGIRTARMDDGEKAGFFQIVFLRFLIAQGLLGMIPLWGLIDILFIFGSEQRCLHDKIAGTQVLDA